MVSTRWLLQKSVNPGMKNEGCRIVGGLKIKKSVEIRLISVIRVL